MQVIKNDIESELIINKSKFITILSYVSDELDISSILNKIKLKYPKANHYCYGYIINNTKRYNDDFEPNQTAGLPILSVLENNNLNYVFCVVVRYFGGIKLGTGGLVRAYTKSITTALDKTEFNSLYLGKKIMIDFKYENKNQIDYILKNEKIVNMEFNDTVIYTFWIKKSEFLNLENKIKKICNTFCILEENYFY